MKLYKYDNGKGTAAINVAAITSLWPEYNHLDDRHCIYYTLTRYGKEFCMVFNDKESRDDQLKHITKMMEEV